MDGLAHFKLLSQNNPLAHTYLIPRQVSVWQDWFNVAVLLCHWRQIPVGLGKFVGMEQNRPPEQGKVLEQDATDEIEAAEAEAITREKIILIEWWRGRLALFILAIHDKQTMDPR